ncbi:head-tail connector protein [Pseudonocardia broussonetiae]|uniref:Phage gp6-like head-tail connector protein n=1 Tax=Pseudonocardia broussonetiae TaxID=2736640 RepID=A0A6M6JJP9_9PSEU|nr:head-tail connector protein [Pseudonocardia broussonetiae]QJY46659.1 phage gp6-like head-tail connector protein [Pseudonocardia broussonetiae]
MSALDVLSVAEAREYLNIRLSFDASKTAEMEGFIAAAVRRVDRHLFGGDGRSLADDPDAVEPEQSLAVRVVLADYYRPQSRAATVATGPTVEDVGVGGRAPLGARLTELLGPPAADVSESAVAAATASGPQGSFPAPMAWPDPAPCWVVR